MATIGDGIVVIAIALAIVGFFWCLTIDNEKSDYQACLDKCPKDKWDNTFAGLECPRMCENITKDANCEVGE